MEKVLLGASLLSRENFQLISEYVAAKKYSRVFQIVFDQVANYYKRDGNVASVDADVLKAMLADVTLNDKHLAEFNQLIDDGRVLAVSEPNIRHLVLEAKKQELGLALAQAIIEEKDHSEVLENYTKVRGMSELGELAEEGVQVLDSTNYRDSLREQADTKDQLVLYPLALSDRIGGGVRPGHHVVVYAPTEAGKSALMLTMAAGFARQGADGLYFVNEDRPQDLLERLVSCLTGRVKDDVRANLDAAFDDAEKRGLNHVRFLSVSPGTPRQIEEYIEKYKPRWIVIDQLRNLAMKSDNRVVQLEAAATAARTLAKKYNIVVISVTQAGDSASGKEVLTTGDVDFSNVGIPAQADLMIGIGVTDALYNQGVRCFSLPKNKLTGEHAHFYVRLRKELSRYETIG